MTLVERCARLKERIDWSRELDARSHEAARIGERKETVDHVRGKVRSAVDRALVLREAVALELPACHAAIVACRDAAAGLRGTTGALKADVVLADDSWKRLTKTIDDDASALETIVRTSIDAARKSVSDVRISGLEAIALAAGKELEFKQLKELQAWLLAGPWYTKPATELRQYLNRRADLLNRVNALSDFGSGASEEARRFLDLARKGEARIADLTPQVRTWLDGKGLLGNLRITLGAN